MKIRARIIARDKVCCECKRQGTVDRLSSIAIVDHIVPLAEGGTDDDENLQGLCRRHSDEKTQGEAARAQGHRAPRRRVSVGIDGWPKER